MTFITSFSPTYREIVKQIKSLYGESFFVSLEKENSIHKITIVINGKTLVKETDKIDWFIIYCERNPHQRFGFNLDSILKNRKQVDKFLTHLGLSLVDFFPTREVLVIPTNQCQIFGSPDSTDIDIALFLNSNQFEQFERGLLDIDTHLISSWLKDNDCYQDFETNTDKIRELDFNICVLRDGPSGKIIHKSSKGKGSLTNNIIYSTVKFHTQPASNNVFIQSLVDLRLNDFFLGTFKYIVDLFFRDLAAHLPQDTLHRLSIQKKEDYITEKPKLCFSILDCVVEKKLNLEMIDVDVMKSLMMKIYQTLLFSVGAEEYCKLEMAQKVAEVFSLRVEELIYPLSRHRSGNKMRIETFQSLVDLLKSAHTGMNMQWISQSFHLCSPQNLDKNVIRGQIFHELLQNNYAAPTHKFLNHVDKHLSEKKIMNYFLQTDESDKIPQWCRNYFLPYTFPNLVMGTDEWKESMNFYKTGHPTAIAPLNEESNYWETYWNLLRGMVFETNMLSPENIDFSLKPFIERERGRKIKTMTPVHLSLLKSKDGKSGCVPDLLLFLVYQNHDDDEEEEDDRRNTDKSSCPRYATTKEIITMEVKAITKSGALMTHEKNTRRCIDLATAQVEKSRKFIKEYIDQPLLEESIDLSSFIIIGNNTTINFSLSHPMTIAKIDPRRIIGDFHPLAKEINRLQLNNMDRVKGHFATIGIKVKFSEDNRLAIFSYEQLKAQWTNPLCLASRGIIFKTSFGGNWEVVCQPFNKFFNYGDSHAPKLVWDNTVLVQRKSDGSIMKLWHDRDIMQWVLSTNNTIYALENYLPSSAAHPGTAITFGQLFWRVAGYYGLTQAKVNQKLAGMEDFTFVFELCTKENEIVVHHSKDHLVHLATFNNHTGKESVDDDDIDIGIPKPQQYCFDSLESVLSAANGFKGSAEEGFVIVKKTPQGKIGERNKTTSVNRWKVKGISYVTLYHHIGKGTIEDVALSAVLSGEEEEVGTYRPDLKVKMETITKRLEEISRKYSLLCKELAERSSSQGEGEEQMKFICGHLFSMGLSKEMNHMITRCFSNSIRRKAVLAIDMNDFKVSILKTISTLGIRAKLEKFKVFLEKGDFL